MKDNSLVGTFCKIGLAFMRKYSCKLQTTLRLPIPSFLTDWFTLRITTTQHYHKTPPPPATVITHLLHTGIQTIALVSTTTKMSATISLVAPIGPGNWPAGAALTNLSASARGRYTSKLTCKFDPFCLLPTSDESGIVIWVSSGVLRAVASFVHIFLFNFRWLRSGRLMSWDTYCFDLVVTISKFSTALSEK
jgi:hypothetical protein